MRRTMLLLFVCIATMAHAQDLPEIDGFIREGEWSDATVFSDFHLISPRSTEKYYDSTIVY
ncbi:MAG TPA: hypothetical protein PK754_06625, partial [bacterium]|nr:hypothetical protein [bacterium]